jgi:glucose uptake protein
MLLGLLGALGAGILWGIYYLPIKTSGASMWIVALPMAVGIFVGSAALLLLGRQSPRMAIVQAAIFWTIASERGKLAR